MRGTCLATRAGSLPCQPRRALQTQATPPCPRSGLETGWAASRDELFRRQCLLLLVLTLLVSRCVRYCSVCSAPPGVVDRTGGLTQHASSPEASDGEGPTDQRTLILSAFPAEADATETALTHVRRPPTSPLRLPTPRCQSPKIWWSSAGSRWRTLVCFHPFPQVLQYTVVEVTPIIVVFTQSVCVTRCRRS